MSYWDKIEWLATYLESMSIGSTLTFSTKLGMAVFTCIAFQDSKMFTIDVDDIHIRSRYSVTAARRVFM